MMLYLSLICTFQFAVADAAKTSTETFSSIADCKIFNEKYEAFKKKVLPHLNPPPTTKDAVVQAFLIDLCADGNKKKYQALYEFCRSNNFFPAAKGETSEKSSVNIVFRFYQVNNFTGNLADLLMEPQFSYDTLTNAADIDEFIPKTETEQVRTVFKYS
jgi:hypothetical protein